MKLKTTFAVLMLLSLCACQGYNTGAAEVPEVPEVPEVQEVVGVSEADCSGSGGTVEEAEGVKMCKMQDGTMAPIL